MQIEEDVVLWGWRPAANFDIILNRGTLLLLIQILNLLIINLIITIYLHVRFRSVILTNLKSNYLHNVAKKNYLLT